MLTIHHLALSQSQKIVWLCEELGLSYQIKRYERQPSGLAGEDYRSLHPAGTSPVVEDDDAVLSESGAIVEYIIHRHGAGRLSVDPNEANYFDYLFWFHFANGSMVPNAQTELVLMLTGAAGDGEAIQAFRSRQGRGYALVEQRLGAAPYFAGAAFTAADIMMAFTLTTLRMFIQQDLADLPNIRAYLSRIGERQAFRAAMEAADPGIPPHLN
jgi:glutathione S-transferase